MRFAIVLLLISWASTSPAAVFQYAIPVETSKDPSTAFLYLPPQAERIRGVVVAGMTLAERDIVQDPRIRRACGQEQLAILFLKCGLSAVDVPKVLDEFARISGITELSTVPLFFIGHSAGGPQAKSLSIKLAPRCFGLMLYRGGVPGGDNAVPPGVPLLMMIGQFDEFGKTMRNADGRETWEGGRDALVAYRAAHEGHLASVVVEPGAGHFAWSDRNAAYFDLFLRRAARARIPDPRPDADGPISCRAIDPRTGWLTDPLIKAQGRDAAAYDKFEGDKTKAAWHFDEESARATVAYHAGISGKLDQFIRWSDPTWVDAGVRHFFTELKWVDAQTFEVHPAYADTYPKDPGAGPGPRWADAGKPASHSTAPILIRPVGGSPIDVAGPNSFRMRFDGLAPAGEGARVTFLAYSDGDEKYRHTEQIGMMPRGFAGLTRGKAQTITFPPIGDLRPGQEGVELRATSDSGLPVEYYVAHGPAVIENGKIRVAELPHRARFPVTVRVVAWQFGSAREPLVRTAAPVEQTLAVRKQ